MKASSISVSQLQDYGNCAKRWQLKRTLKIPFKRSLALIFGSAVHAGLETFNYDLYSQEVDGVKRVSKRIITPKEFKAAGFSKVASVEPPPDEALPVDMEHVFLMMDDSFDKQMAEDVEGGGDPLKDEWDKIQRQKNSRKALKVLSLDAFRVHIVAELKGIGRQLLQQYHDGQFTYDDTYEGTPFELGDRALFIEEKGTTQVEGLPFRYIADLVDEKAGVPRLVDYKTRAKSDPHIAAMQLVVYAWILKKQHNVDIQEIYQLNFVKTASNPRIQVLQYDLENFEADEAMFHEEVKTFLKGTESNVFPRHRSPFCVACGVKEVCHNPKLEKEHIEAQRQKERDKLLVSV